MKDEQIEMIDRLDAVADPEALAKDKAEESGWWWFAGSSDEWYEYGPFATRDEAEHTARVELEGGYIVEARQDPVPLKDFFDARRFVEDVNDRQDELITEDGDGPFDEISQVQMDDLQKRVREAIGVWQRKHGLVFEPKMFTGSRNHQYIDHHLKPEDLSDRALSLWLGFFMTRNSSLSFGGEGAEMMPTMEALWALDELLAAEAIRDCGKNGLGREKYEAMDLDLRPQCVERAGGMKNWVTWIKGIYFTVFEPIAPSPGA